MKPDKKEHSVVRAAGGWPRGLGGIEEGATDPVEVGEPSQRSAWIEGW